MSRLFNYTLAIFLAIGVLLSSVVSARRFIVTLRNEGSRRQHLNFVRNFRNGSSTNRVLREWSFGGRFPGYVVDSSESFINLIRSNAAVASIEPDSVMKAWWSYQTQNNTPSWGLDRIDQRGRPLDFSYSFLDSRGTGVDVYVIDTGIRASHTEFEGRASVVRSYYASTTDDNGHGSHCAGTIGGRTTGVAKNVTLKGIKVLDASGSGYNSDIIDAINWVVTQFRATGRKSVISLSLGGSRSSAMNNAVNAAWSAGVIPVVAAGNSNADAYWYSPASATNAITVGATVQNDERASYSNYGTLVDLHAPGSSIYSAWNRNDTDYTTISGTSMATPHVAGVVAQIWSAFPSYTPSQVLNLLITSSTKNVITRMRTRSTPNRLLYGRFV